MHGSPAFFSHTKLMTGTDGQYLKYVVEHLERRTDAFCRRSVFGSLFCVKVLPGWMCYYFTSLLLLLLRIINIIYLLFGCLLLEAVLLLSIRVCTFTFIAIQLPV